MPEEGKNAMADNVENEADLVLSKESLDFSPRVDREQPFHGILISQF
jgi:hypothetical protein